MSGMGSHRRQDKATAVTPGLGPILRANVKTELLDRMCRLIADRGLGLGDRFPSENELIKLFGVSRPSIREAISALSSMGILEQRVGSGTFMAARLSEPILQRIKIRISLTPEQFVQVLEARRVLEGEFAALAAVRATPEDLAEIDRHRLAVKEHRDDAQRSTEDDFAFHSAIARSSGSPLLVDVYDHIADQMFQQHYFVTLREKRLTDRSLAHHDAIVDAIRRRDSEEARRQMHAHLDDVLSRVSAFLDNPDPTGVQPDNDKRTEEQGVKKDG